MRTLALWLTIALIATMPLETMVEVEGLGTASRLVAIPIGLFWLLTVVVGGRVRRPTVLHGLLFAFLVWNFASLLWTFDLQWTFRQVFSLGFMFALTIMIHDICSTPRAIHWAMQAYVIGALIPALDTIFNFLTGRATEWARYSASGIDFNSTGTILAVAIPLALYVGASLGPSPLDRLRRLASYAAVPVLLFSIALTATRFAMLMAAVGCAYGALTVFRLRLTGGLVAVAATAAIAVGGLTLVPEASVQRLATTGTEISSGDLNHRMLFWQEAFEIWLQHPIVGTGANTFPVVSESARSVHSSYFATLAELGIVGFALWLAILLSAVRMAWGRPFWESLFWLTALTLLVMASTVMTLVADKHVWIILALLAAGSGRPAEAPVPARERPALTVLRRPNWAR